jgi:hypothetical protein
MDYSNDTESNDELCARARAEERTITSEVNRDRMKSRKTFEKKCVLIYNQAMQNGLTRSKVNLQRKEYSIFLAASARKTK